MKNPLSTINLKIKNVHFIGIGGSGMSGIAEVLSNLGYCISGSDVISSQTTARLEKLGCKIYYQHHADNLVDVQAVVVSSAINKNNPEIIKAKELNIPIVPRAEMLAEIMRFRFGIAIAGTHGKTTVTSLVAHILNVAKLDPTYIIGGILKSSGINAKLGASDYLIAEADESDASFLYLKPMLSVITNIDKDHMEAYDNDYQNLKDAFISFTSNLPFYGSCVACIDDAGVKDIAPKMHRSVITYGFSDGADIQAINLEQHDMQMHFNVVCRKHDKEFLIKLNLIGKHNVLNTLAAIGVALEVGVQHDIIQQALFNFAGVARRLDYYGDIVVNNHKALLFDDYGHHPNEIEVVFASLRNTYKDRRLVVIFQPHRYSRTRDLFDDFARILAQLDVLILLDIYTAGEDPIANISSSSLAASIRKRSILDPIVVKESQEILNILPNVINDNDVVLTLGAGSVSAVAKLLISNYATC